MKKTVPTMTAKISPPKMKTNIEKALALLEAVTPLRVDCGKLCGGRCCHADKEAEGMRLFPDEPPPKDLRVSDTADGGRLAVCDGTCDRHARPLACRIFPLFPYLGTDGRVRAVWDPRAWRVCPLVQGKYCPDRAFIRAVRKAGRLLAATESGRRFLKEQAAEIDQLAALIPRWQLLPRRNAHKE